MAHRDGDYLLVAALDLGTTFSGYAFSLKTNPEKIICNNNWGEEYGFKSHKTPTSILTNSVGEFIAMGYRAEQKYNAEMEEMEEGAGFHLFRNFKMALHKSKNVSLKTTISSEDGTIRPAVDIFGFAIAYLKNHVMNIIRTKTDAKLEPHNIFWVITVPAIWSEPAKKFMRTAAMMSGCIESTDAKNLMLALEPEAASMCCRRPKIAGYISSDGLAFPTETKYLVLDCGGGTIDVTAHQIIDGKKIKEVLPASGGPWGGMYVDKEFIRLLEEICGTDFLNRYKSDHPQGWVELLNSFEMAKKPFNERENHFLKVALPWSFGEFHSVEKEGKSIKNVLHEHGDLDIKYMNGSIVLRKDAAKRLFMPLIQKITSHVGDLLENPKLHDCRYIFMVGGFSDSCLLQDQVKKHFERNGTKVLIPSEAQLAVLKGAVLFGHFPIEFTARIARKTYGYGLYCRFDAIIHDSKRKFISEIGEEYCKDVFMTLVKQGESVPVGHEITRTTWPPSKNDTSTSMPIYCIDGQPDHPVQYTDLPGVECIGEAVTTLPPCNHRKENAMTNIFTFGSTGIYKLIRIRVRSVS